MKFVGFVGPKGSGKDESAKILKDLRASKGKLSFAGPLKKICSEVFNIPIQMFNDPQHKESEIFPGHGGAITLNRKHFRELKNKLVEYVSEMDHTLGVWRYKTATASVAGLEGREIKTYRQLLQVIGTDFIRDRVFEDWHVMAAFGDKVLDELVEGVYCITDTRFPNELAYLQNKFGEDFQCFYVERPEAEERLANATHASELNVKVLREALGEDAVIMNDGSKDDLKKSLKPLATELKEVMKNAKTSVKPTGKSRFIYGPAR